MYTYYTCIYNHIYTLTQTSDRIHPTCTLATWYSGSDVVRGLKEHTGLEIDQLILSEIYSHTIFKTYFEDGEITTDDSCRNVKKSDFIIAFEVTSNLYSRIHAS